MVVLEELGELFVEAFKVGMTYESPGKTDVEAA